MPQNREIQHGKNRLSIKSDRLLLVEGRDEVNLFNALIWHSLGDESNIQVIDAGGKDQFPTSLQAIRTEAKTRPAFRSFGVVRDADDNPTGAFQSVCAHLRNVEYEAPQSHGTFSNASPSVGVFIVPDGIECGTIEALCRRSVEDSNIAQCVEQYLECLATHDVIASTNREKSFAHAYLAAMRDPVARVGEGAQRGVWNFDSPAFQEILCFIRDLS